ncbi:class I SAM-dependent methyltransferase [Aureispira anguillae]|uniref:Class I SAM-dependent methyltransferase n=1 Tax=Aureispira anguillae TaxID=2864201 RepID=A0A915YKM0_9BACT|nr:class I SAM-dependent methyltransferase [Aureispira anguillae]BDS14523.1 class I SAM-dependent methyltransferase [Aureispira anguillae]
MIRKWHLKAIIQKTISFMPNGHKINHWFQKNITKGVYLGDEYFYDRLEHVKHHISAFQQFCGPIKGKKTLELGTGWYPVIPFSFFLSGASEINTVDISNLTNKEKLKDTIDRFIDLIEQNKLSQYIDALPERVATLQQIHKDFETLSFETILARLNIRYIIMDARKLSHIPTGSIDLVHSNNTFEHVYPDVLKDILKEFKRIVSPTGFQSHFIDMSDHFAHFDHSINIYNFLQYSNTTWDKIIDNSIQPQNRWRFPQFVNLYQELNIPLTDTETRPGDIEAVNSLKIHSDFSNFSTKELAISHCYMYSKMN